MSGTDRAKGRQEGRSDGGDGFAGRVARDFRRLRRVKGRGFWMALLDALFFDSGFQALLLHRCAHALRRAGVPVLPAALRRVAVGACGVDLLPAADVGGGCIVPHGLGLVVGGETVIGRDCTLLHGVTLGEVRFDETACPRLGDRVTVGAGAIVLGGITVGDDAVVGAGAVVLTTVPPGARVAGVPARVVGWVDGSRETSDSAGATASHGGGERPPGRPETRSPAPHEPSRTEGTDPSPPEPVHEGDEPASDP